MRRQLIRSFSSAWKAIPETPNDPILYFNQLYAKDSNPSKVNLAVGAYADDNGKPWVLPAVNLAIQKLQSAGNLPFGYLGMTGDAEFTEESVKLAFGFDSKTNLLAGTYALNQIARTQSLSGTGAVSTAYTTVQQFYKNFDNKVWTPNPTWPIHNTMAKIMGMDVKNYFYYDLEKREFDSKKYLTALKEIPKNSFVVLHSSGHNPTGYDVTTKEWQEVVDICKERGFLVLMDTAYQGFVSGDLILDGYPVRLMAENKVPLMVAQSYAKNMGLYGQRTGCLSIACADEGEAKRMTDFLGQRNRNVFSNPPRFGSDIAKTILKDQQIYGQWLKDIKTMSDAINTRRNMLLEALKTNGCPGSWDYILKQKGMFAFTQLQKAHCTALREKFSVYMTENGRISVTGLNTKNAEYVGKAIADVMKNTKA
jgi:aspartate/tyrosine/aromatic aminotransferase